MALFRFHGPSLSESLKNTKIVKTIAELKLMLKIHEAQFGFNLNLDLECKIIPYIFDDRIGWHTQLVSTNLYEKDKFIPIGYLSEPLDDN